MSKTCHPFFKDLFQFHRSTIDDSVDQIASGDLILPQPSRDLHDDDDDAAFLLQSHQQRRQVRFSSLVESILPDGTQALNFDSTIAYDYSAPNLYSQNEAYVHFQMTPNTLEDFPEPAVDLKGQKERIQEKISTSTSTPSSWLFEDFQKCLEHLPRKELQQLSDEEAHGIAIEYSTLVNLLKTLQPNGVLKAYHVYTDGSANKTRTSAAWAFFVIIEIIDHFGQSHFDFGGHAQGLHIIDPTSNDFIEATSCQPWEAENSAIIWALAWILSQAQDLHGVPVYMHTDNKALEQMEHGDHLGPSRNQLPLA